MAFLAQLRRRSLSSMVAVPGVLVKAEDSAMRSQLRH